MYLKQADSGHLVEVLDLQDLIDPHRGYVLGRFHFGQEPSDPERVDKAMLLFPSNEPLPRCWRDPHYRDSELGPGNAPI